MHTTTNLVTPISTESTPTRAFAAGARAISPLVMEAARTHSRSVPPRPVSASTA